MKLLLIEGLDRCGKNTLIRNLTSQAENYVVRHFGSAKGSSDKEKRANQFSFFQKEFELSNLRHRFDLNDRNRYPRDLWIMNRAHLGEFVYGKIYRDTRPEEWVWELEKSFNFHIDPTVYLILLTAPPEFLCKNDDGKSFSSDVEYKAQELEAFRKAFQGSSIMNKLEIDVSDGESYLDSSIILEQANKFIFE